MTQPFDPAQSYDPAPPAMPNRKFALWALILGIVAIFLALFLIGGIIGLVAAVLGIVALVKPGPKGMAIAGLVTGIFSIGIALIAVMFWAGVAFAFAQGPSRARTMTARAEIAHLRAGINNFEVDTSRYPSTAEGLGALVNRPAAFTPAQWHGPYIIHLDKDPWGHDFIYQWPGTTNPHDFDLYSAGPDGIPGTSDDITGP